MNAPAFLDHPAVRRLALPISVEQYHALSEAGIVPERTELLGGVIVSQMTKSPLHSYLVQLLVSLFTAQLPEGFYCRMEQPLTLETSEPEPDVAIVSGSPFDYRQQHPAAAALAVEVAISSEEIDRNKAQIYAAAGIEEYWLVLPESKQVERFSEPRDGAYSQCEIMTGEMQLTSKSSPTVAISVGELFAA